MKILVFDTETTGLPKRRNASTKCPEDFPYVVQLSFILYDVDKQQVDTIGDYIIKLPDNVEIEEGAVRVHGISKDRSQNEGIPMEVAYEQFAYAYDQADLLVAHNLVFDRDLMIVEATRNGYNPCFNSNTEEYCTMMNTINLCRLERVSQRTGNVYYKYPKLSELHNNLFGYVPDGLHDSLSDILCCLRCYFKLTHDKDILYDNRQLASLWREKCIATDVIMFR